MRKVFGVIIGVFMMCNVFAQTQGNIPLHNLRAASGANFVIKSGANGKAQWVKDTVYYTYTDGVLSIQDNSGLYTVDMRDTLFGTVDTTGLVELIKSVAPITDSIAWANITNKPVTFTPTAHLHSIVEVNGLLGALDGKSDTSHVHPISDVISLQDSLNARSKLGHTHVINDVAFLQDNLNLKSNVNHNHDERYYTEPQTDSLLLAKSDTSHTHTKDEVGLANVDNTSDLLKPVSIFQQAALDLKANIGHNHVVANVQGLQDSLNFRLTQNDTIAWDSVMNLGGIITRTSPTSSYPPIIIKTDSVQSAGFPEYKYLVTRFDGVNGVDPNPNLVVREGFNPGVIPPNGQISIEDATEYYYNLNTQNPAQIVAEKHWEFRPRPESARPTQRWLTFAGRHDGTRTEFGYTADYITVRNSNNQVIKLTDHSLAGRSVETYPKGVQFIAQTNDITFENNLRISGLGNIYNDNGNNLNFGTSTNNNISTFYGRTAINGAILRLKNNNAPNGWGVSINNFPSLRFIDETTGNAVLGLFNGAPNNALVVRASGNVGINQGSPLYTLDVTGNFRLTDRSGTPAHRAMFDASGKLVQLDGLANKSEIGLSNVDNTSDINKPISTATQTALDNKIGTLTATEPLIVTGSGSSRNISYTGLRGKGVDGRLAFWGTSDTITSDANLFWNNTSKKLNIGNVDLGASRLNLFSSTSGNVFNVQTNGVVDGNSIFNVAIGGPQVTGNVDAFRIAGPTSGFLSTLIQQTGSGNVVNIIRTTGSGMMYSYYEKSGDVAKSWSVGNNQANGRFFINNGNFNGSAALTIANTTRVVRINTLATNLTAPVTTGPIKIVVSDQNGDLSNITIPTYATTAAAAADGALTAGSFFKVSNGNGTSALHIKD